MEETLPDFISHIHDHYRKKQFKRSQTIYVFLNFLSSPPKSKCKKQNLKAERNVLFLKHQSHLIEQTGMNSSRYCAAQGHMLYSEKRVNNSFMQTDFCNLGEFSERRGRARLHKPESVMGSLGSLRSAN